MNRMSTGSLKANVILFKTFFFYFKTKSAFKSKFANIKMINEEILYFAAKQILQNLPQRLRTFTIDDF